MSTGEVERCRTCGALVDVEDLFCPNCGTEIPERTQGASRRLATGAQNFQCRGCGASMNYDATAQALKCPFCGSVDLEKDAGQSILAPEVVLPFAFERGEAEDRLRAWLGSSFWHPDDLRSSAQLTGLTAVYVPFWIFTTRVETNWTADTSHTPPGAYGSWYPITGSRMADYADLWVPASTGIPAAELQQVVPFDPSKGVDPEMVDLRDVTVEQFTVSRRYARPTVQSLVESLEAEASCREAPGSKRNVHVNVLMEGAESRAALAPLYVLAYRYGDEVYRFVINGQTGKATGTAPRSVKKALMIVGFVAIILALVVVLLAR